MSHVKWSRWTEGELGELARLLQSAESTAQLYAAMPHRPRSGIAHKAMDVFPELWDRFRKRRRHDDSGAAWAKADLAKLARLLQTCSEFAQIAERFQTRSLRALRYQARTAFPALYQKFARKVELRRFTKAEDDYILQHYGLPGSSAKTIAEALGRDSRCEIISRAQRLRAARGPLQPRSGV
jgi:hypothetical protein